MSFEDKHFIFTRKSSARSSIRMGVSSLKCSPKIRTDLAAQNLTPVMRRENKLSLANRRSPCDNYHENASHRISKSYLMAEDQASLFQSSSTKSPNPRMSRITPISTVCERSLINSIQNKTFQNSDAKFQEIGIFLI